MTEDSVLHKIYVASRNGMARLVSRIVPPNEIEDIVQETYVRICQIENKESITSPKSFMYRTAKNLALDYQKQSRVKLVDNVEDNHELESIGRQHTDELFKDAVIKAEFADLCEAVRQLPQQCRKVFVLKKVYGYSQKEIAAQLDISESTVEKHISMGIKRCTLFMRKNAQTENVATAQTRSVKPGRGV